MGSSLTPAGRSWAEVEGAGRAGPGHTWLPWAEDFPSGGCYLPMDQLPQVVVSSLSPEVYKQKSGR